jgi:hypothetical protein
MNAVSGNVAQRGVDHALALQPGNPGEPLTFDKDGEVRFARSVVPRVAVVAGGIVDDIEAGGGKGGFEKLPHFHGERSGHAFHLGAMLAIWKTVRRDRFHGRYEGASCECQWPGCSEAGEFRAPGRRPPGFDGPGEWRWFCLDHVREFNAGYDYFEGMDAEEILRAQSPIGGWDTQTRAFRPDAGIDDAPRWNDYADPLEAISRRAREHVRQRRAEMGKAAKAGHGPHGFGARFSPEEQRALKVLGLEQDVDRKTLRMRYTRLVRRFHPDHNGGDRSHEARLQLVVNAYQTLRKAHALG